MSRWFRLYDEMLDDPKVQRLAPDLFKAWVNLLCLANRNGGCLPGIEDIAFALRVDDDRATEIVTKLIELGLLDPQEDGDLCPAEWFRHKSDYRPSGQEWAETRARVFARDDYTCRYCGEYGGRLECDHVVPVSRGGPHTDENLVAACFRCNRSKRNKTLQEWRAE